MLVHVLLAQRSCAYTGEFAPELVEAVSDNVHDDNPALLTEAIENIRNSPGEFDNHCLFDVAVDNDAIDQALAGGNLDVIRPDNVDGDYLAWLLIAQRTCRYEGEYAPEILAAVDEYLYDENPAWMHARIAEHRDSSDFDSVAVLPIALDPKIIDRYLNARPSMVAATFAPNPA